MQLRKLLATTEIASPQTQCIPTWQGTKGGQCISTAKQSAELNCRPARARINIIIGL